MTLGRLLVDVAPGLLCVGTVLLVVTYALGLFLFRPMYEANVLFRVNSRFRISDLIILAAHLQIAVAASLAVLPRDPAAQAAVSLFVSGIVVCWWTQAVRMLSRAGIEYTWHRWFFLAVIMPVGYLTCLLFPVALILLPYAGIILARGVIAREALPIVGGMGLLALIPLLFGSGVFCRRGSLLICQRAKADRARRDGIEFQKEIMRTRSTPLACLDGIDWVDPAEPLA